MKENPPHCPECSAALPAAARFCPVCGKDLTQQSEHNVQLTSGSPLQEVLAAASTVAKGVQSVQQAVQIARKVESIVVRPPAQWKVVTEELLVPAGQTFVDAALAATQRLAAPERVDGTPPLPAGTLKCTACGAPLKTGARFCGQCGAAAGSVRNSNAKSLCPSCGHEVTLGKKFCGSCGHKLG